MEWTGWIPFDALPHVFDPPDHVIVTANHRPMPPDVSARSSRSSIPSRTARSASRDLARERRRGSRRTTSSACRRTPTRLHAERSCRCCCRRADAIDDIDRRALELLRAWTLRRDRGDSAAAAIFQAWFLRLAPAIAGDELGARLLDGYQGRFSFVTRFVTATLVHDRTAPGATTCTTPASGDVRGRWSTRALQRGVGRADRPSSATTCARWRWAACTAACFPIRGSTRWPFCGRCSAGPCRTAATGARSTSAPVAADQPLRSELDTGLPPDRRSVTGQRQPLPGCGRPVRTLPLAALRRLHRGLAGGAAPEDADGARRDRSRCDSARSRCGLVRQSAELKRPVRCPLEDAL